VAGGLLWLVGLPMWVLMLRGVIGVPIGLFQHANLRLPAALDRALGHVICSPAIHRVHHSPRVDETNANYGQMFSFWDRLFGTYRAPRLRRAGRLRPRAPRRARVAGRVGHARHAVQGARHRHALKPVIRRADRADRNKRLARGARAPYRGVRPDVGRDPRRDLTMDSNRVCVRSCHAATRRSRAVDARGHRRGIRRCLAGRCSSCDGALSARVAAGVALLVRRSRRSPGRARAAAYAPQGRTGVAHRHALRRLSAGRVRSMPCNSAASAQA
jgi:hypothetical protein